MLGTGLRFVGLTRGISDFDPSRQSDQQTFYHFHPDEETLIRAALALELSFAPPAGAAPSGSALAIALFCIGRWIAHQTCSLSVAARALSRLVGRRFVYVADFSRF